MLLLDAFQQPAAQRGGQDAVLLLQTGGDGFPIPADGSLYRIRPIHKLLHAERWILHHALCIQIRFRFTQQILWDPHLGCAVLSHACAQILAPCRYHFLKLSLLLLHIDLHLLPFRLIQSLLSFKLPAQRHMRSHHAGDGRKRVKACERSGVHLIRRKAVQLIHQHRRHTVKQKNITGLGVGKAHSVLQMPVTDRIGGPRGSGLSQSAVALRQLHQPVRSDTRARTGKLLKHRLQLCNLGMIPQNRLIPKQAVFLHGRFPPCIFQNLAGFVKAVPLSGTQFHETLLRIIHHPVDRREKALPLAGFLQKALHPVFPPAFLGLAQSGRRTVFHFPLNPRAGIGGERLVLLQHARNML